MERHGGGISRPTAMAATQEAAPAGPPYCSDLKPVTTVAMSEWRLSRLVGEPREGSFSDTILPLTGWNDCSEFQS